ncbi:MAG TPA: lamin tail domain-containing protein, partial [Anaerolineales bacterium]|nr:lamin tail domain-containing protein [Anaerolineales bacterium]
MSNIKQSRMIWGICICILLAMLGARTTIAAPLDVVVNEVNWGATDEWVELYNPGAVAIDIGGWTLSEDANQFVFPSPTILNPGAFLIIDKDGGATAPTGDFSLPTLGLSNSGDTITLTDATTAVVDTVSFDTGWPAGNNTGTLTLSRRLASIAGSIAGNWASSIAVGGTPKAANDVAVGAFLAVDPLGGVVATEGGATDTFQISILGSAPSADVTVTLTTGTQVTLSPTILTFTPANASIPQVVIVTAIDDAVSEGYHTTNVTVSATSADIALNGASSVLSVAINDNDAPTPDGIYISEVGWMGTVANGGHEYIELCNGGATPLSFVGWRLKGSDGTPNIDLSFVNGGGLVNGACIVLESDASATNIAGAFVYTGSLSTSGETLQLIDQSNVLRDSANIAGAAWSSGSAFPTYASMERNVCGGLPTADGPASWMTNDTLRRSGATDALGIVINGTLGSITNFMCMPVVPPPALSIVINEIAWAGNGSDTADEWIELYNPTGTAVDISGWVLYSVTDGGPSFTFPLGTILTAGGYLILEHDDDTAISDVVANFIYTGFLTDTGESLVLLNASRQVVDSANLDGGAWPAGNTYTALP